MEIFLGAVVSLVVQYLKAKLATDTKATMLAVLVLSFVAAAGYVMLMDTSIWPTIVQVFVAAGAFYAYIIQRFEK